MKKKVWVSIIFLLVIIMACGCAGKKPIKIGLVGTMTGKQSDLSVSGRRGVEIAIEKINNNGGIHGRKIELVIKDDLFDQNRAKEIVGEFVKEGIQIVIGHYTSGEMTAAYDEVKKQDILYLGPTISADALGGIDDNFIRFIASTKEQAQIITKVALEKKQKKFVVIIDNKNIGFNEMLYKNFEDCLNEGGESILTKITYDNLDDDTIVKISNEIKAQKEVESLFIISNASDLATITKECRKRNIESTIYGPLWAHTDDLLRIGGEYVDGVNVVSGVDYDNTSEEFIEFQDAFYKKYGKEVSFSSIYSYEAMMALSIAIESVGNTDPKKVKAKIIEIGTFQGLQEKFLIDQYGDNTRNYMLDQIMKGGYVRVDNDE